MTPFQLLSFLIFTLSTYSSVNAQPNIICNSAKFQLMGTNMNSLPFCDQGLSYHVRAKDLVDRMTLQEKVAQLGDQAVGVERLNLPGYQWWSEALHGVSDVGHGTHFDNNITAATSFPTVILSTASFNETLWKTIGEAVSNEARAMHNLGLAGLTFWSPNINVARDPRWGRILETPGEDPFVVGRYATNYVRGLQDVKGYLKTKDPNSRPLKVGACCKHFAAYDVDNWKGIDRYHFDARVTERDMVETFLLPFEMCVKEGDVASVMCSYNRINGIPTCADPKLLNQTIRERWNLHGYIAADCDSIEVMIHGHKYHNDTPEEAVAQTLKAGLDLDCGSYYSDYATAAVKEGLVKEEEIDHSLHNLYIVLMRLGWFDGTPGGAFTGLGKNDICSPQNLELSADAARQGIVLLKNNNTLPLSFGSGDQKSTFAVVGPHANATIAMIGNYALQSGIACHYSTPLDEISAYGNVKYEPGCSNVKCENGSGVPIAVQTAQGADATFVFVGLDLSVEAESLDRIELKFPGWQEALITELAYAPNVGPIIVVIFSAGGIDISTIKNHPRVSAIIWAGYPGAEGGRAIADIIFGNYNPAGRLPITWYPADYVNKLPMTSMQLRPNPDLNYPGRTYKFYNGSTVYPFGYGLSYTNFTYTIQYAPTLVTIDLAKLQKCKQIELLNGVNLDCPAVLVEDSKCREIVKIVVRVRNTGQRDGAHVVLLYSVPPSNIAGTPIKRLVAFRRVFLRVGEVKTLSFKLNACKSFSIIADDAYELLPTGEHSVVIGNGADAVSTKISMSFQFQ
ncbi:hypothetical protein GIB67_024842 [Kingdonia uniflora]|uniref:Fibronectin type III-like domain-containing protein n=1 Tax=Kingdonia uniflora TaxID=39325 RepID=A0A7J7NYP5_9MAGN|nr:hypothetical protein GIB67_024842 [Kingdonia uniflora]